MNIELQRVFEGITRVLRADVIPNVSDPFARGQAVGVIDLINNVSARVEWARAPLLAAVKDKQRLLTSVAEALGEAAPQFPAGLDEMQSSELTAHRARLDAGICEAMRRAHARCAEPPASAALGMLIRHAHDEASEEMKLTRKPLFGEISSGRNEKAVRRTG